MDDPAARVWFHLCRVIGRLLRTARYSQTRVIQQGGERRVRKRRAFYAPLLLRLSRPLLAALGAGVRVLPQKAWEEREREWYRILRGAAISVDGRTLVFPCLPGRTLAATLEDSALDEAERVRAITLATSALAEFHARGFTHGDAMADNVLVDLEAGRAHWFDFETMHEESRSIAWRRADDLRALLATCLVRTPPAKLAESIRVILESYGAGEVTRMLPSSFNSVWRRPLPFHLGQAGFTLRQFREIARRLEAEIF